MGRVGSCFDNAAAEAFFSTLEWEVLSRHEFAGTDQARAVVLDWCSRLLQPPPPAQLCGDDVTDQLRERSRPTGRGIRSPPRSRGKPTFGQLRRARRHDRRNPAGLAPDADIREILDDDPDLPDGFELVTSWVFHGQGYLDLDTAAAAVHSAAMARIRPRA